MKPEDIKPTAEALVAELVRLDVIKPEIEIKWLELVVRQNLGDPNVFTPHQAFYRPTKPE